MALIEEAIISRLTTDPNVTTLISNRVHSFVLPQASTLPAVVMTNVDRIPFGAMGTQATLFAGRLQFDVYAKTVASAKAAANAIRKSLDALDTTVSGVRIYGIVFLSEADEYENDTQLFRVRSEFRAMFTQT